MRFHCCAPMGRRAAVPELVDGRLTGDWEGEDEPASSIRWGVVPSSAPSLRVERMRRPRCSGASALNVGGRTLGDDMWRDWR